MERHKRSSCKGLVFNSGMGLPRKRSKSTPTDDEGDEVDDVDGSLSAKSVENMFKKRGRTMVKELVAT